MIVQKRINEVARDKYMMLATIGTAEIIALIALVIGVIATIAAIVVIHNAKLKYGLLISLSLVIIISIIVLLTLPRDSKPENSNAISSGENQGNSNSTSSQEIQKHKDSLSVKQPSISPPQIKENTGIRPKYLVTLIIPSHMSDAEILVDESPAVITERRLSVVRMLVEQKNQPVRILLRKGEKRCEQTILVQKNMELTPCQ